MNKDKDCPTCVGDGFVFETCQYCEGNAGMGCRECRWNGDVKLECLDCRGTGKLVPDDDDDDTDELAAPGSLGCVSRTTLSGPTAAAPGALFHAGTGVENGKPAQDPTAKRSPSELLHGGMETFGDDSVSNATDGNCRIQAGANTPPMADYVRPEDASWINRASVAKPAARLHESQGGPTTESSSNGTNLTGCHVPSDGTPIPHLLGVAPVCSAVGLGAVHSLVPPAAERSFPHGQSQWGFMDELYARQLAAMPHHRQAVILAFPHGCDARELAGSVVKEMEDKWLI